VGHPPRELLVSFRNAPYFFGFLISAAFPTPHGNSGFPPLGRKHQPLSFLPALCTTSGKRFFRAQSSASSGVVPGLGGSFPPPGLGAPSRPGPPQELPFLVWQYVEDVHLSARECAAISFRSAESIPPCRSPSYSSASPYESRLFFFFFFSIPVPDKPPPFSLPSVKFYLAP